MATVTSLITTAKMGKFADMTAADGLIYFNEINNELCSSIPIIKLPEYIVLTAGTREYDLNALTTRVWEADYITADGVQPIGIRGKQVQEYERIRRGWRNDNITSVPTEFYVDRSDDAQVIGFDPVPNVTTDPATTSGYPIVRLRVSRIQSLASGDTVPVALSMYQLYTFGIRYRFCLDHRTEEAPFWKDLYEKAKMREESIQETRNFQAPPKMQVLANRFGGSAV